MISWYRHGGKRLLDLFLSLFGLIVFGLPMAWIGWRLSRKFKEGPLFKQTRVGFESRHFVILKFRTMTPEGEIPPLCRKLRDTAMDELPQLFNIFKGQMSFVGPRPLIPQELEFLNRVPHGRLRQSVRPGLAGLAQLYEEKTPQLMQRLKWDLAYARLCSFRLDLWIILRSIWVTLHGAWEDQGPKAPPLEV